ncbi:MAG: hypothetical protein FD126_2168 [Elusimicrobia bacterium]|nr:MAG: hypothetical protein FD126_2168 [Elusimicrobiota bacterium]
MPGPLKKRLMGIPETWLAELPAVPGTELPECRKTSAPPWLLMRNTNWTRLAEVTALFSRAVKEMRSLFENWLRSAPAESLRKMPDGEMSPAQAGAAARRSARTPILRRGYGIRANFLFRIIVQLPVFSRLFQTARLTP